MSRNALMDRMPMQGAPPQQMAAAPMEEPPPNPLMQRRGPEQPQEADPTAIFMQKAQAAGVDIEQALKGGGDQNQVLNEAMKAIWAKEPTDENGEMLEELSKHLGVPPPWQQGEGMMKLGGPDREEEPWEIAKSQMRKNGVLNVIDQTDNPFGSEAREAGEQQFHSPSAERYSDGINAPLNRYWQQRLDLEKQRKSRK